MDNYAKACYVAGIGKNRWVNFDEDIKSRTISMVYKALMQEISYEDILGFAKTTRYWAHFRNELESLSTPETESKVNTHRSGRRQVFGLPEL